MWPKFLRLKIKCFSQDEGKPLTLHVKKMFNVNSKALSEFNEVQWIDDWRNVKGSNPNLLSWLPSLGLKLPMSFQYLEWHYANKSHGMA
jgi:hypothetical protein